MTSAQPAARLEPTGEPRAAVAAVQLVLGIGALVAVLAVVKAPMFDLDRFAVPKELALLATATLAGLVALAGARRFAVGIVGCCLLGFAALSVVSAVGATNHWLALRGVGITLAAATVFAAARWAGHRSSGVLVAACLVAAILAGSATGLLQAYGWTADLLADTRAPGGSLGNRNFMAHLTVIGLPLLFLLAATARRRPVFLVAAAGLAMMTAAVVLSRSRAAWVGAGAVAIVTAIAVLAGRRAGFTLDRRRAGSLALAAAAGLLGALILPNRLSWSSSSPFRDSLRGVLNYQEGSGRGRLIQYRNSLRLLRRDPIFGVGPGNWMVAYPLVTTPGDPSFAGHDPIPTNPWPSSDWVATVTERGPLAALCWTGFLLTAAVVSLRRIRDPERGPAAVAALGVLAAVGTQGLFDAVLLLAPPTLIAMAALGTLLPPTRPVVDRPLERKARWVAGFLAVAAVLLWHSAGELRAVVTAGNGWSRPDLVEAARADPGNYRLHLALAQRLPCPAAREHAERAAALLPNHPFPARLLRRCR
ncbi:MAG: O-antigen ligase family protein [Gemmatimonadales bacterium]